MPTLSCLGMGYSLCQKACVIHKSNQRTIINHMSHMIMAYSLNVDTLYGRWRQYMKRLKRAIVITSSTSPTESDQFIKSFLLPRPSSLYLFNKIQQTQHNGLRIRSFSPTFFLQLNCCISRQLHELPSKVEEG